MDTSERFFQPTPFVDSKGPLEKPCGFLDDRAGLSFGSGFGFFSKRLAQMEENEEKALDPNHLANNQLNALASMFDQQRRTREAFTAWQEASASQQQSRRNNYQWLQQQQQTNSKQ